MEICTMFDIEHRRACMIHPVSKCEKLATRLGLIDRESLCAANCAENYWAVFDFGN